MKKYLFTLIGTFLCSLMFAGKMTANNLPGSVNEAAPIKIYGALVMGNEGKTPCGIYSFEVAPTLQVTEVHKDNRINSFCNGTYANGKYYAYLADFEYGYMMTQLSYIVFDIEDWSVLSEKQLQPDQMNRPTHLFYDGVSEKMYAYINSAQTFYEVNLETGALTQVCTIGDKFFNMFVVDSFGKIYATDSNGDFFTLNLQEASYNLIGNTKFGTTTTCSGVIDPASGRFFMAYCPSYGSNTKLVEIDAHTGEGTELAAFPQGERFSSLFIKGGSKVDYTLIPSIPTDLTVTYKVPGEKDATFKVVAPSVAFDKTTALTENMTVHFYVDETEVGKVADVAPGAEVSFDYTLTAGAHMVKVEAENVAGFGPSASVKTFAGFDAPLPAADVNFTIDEAGNYSLIWSAPAKGVNNGEIDPSALRYKVVAYPGGKVVEESSQVTAHFGKISSNELKDYYFGVSVIYGDQVGEEVQSNHIVFGDYAYIPYVEDFATTETWALYTCVDYNDDGHTWEYDERRKCAAYLGNVNAGDDFLFTPAFNMRAYISYTLTFGAESAFNQKCGLKIYAAQSTEIPWGGPSEMNKLLDIPVGDMYESHSVTFTPTEDGICYFAFECESNPDYKLFLKDLNVMASAAGNAPAEVSNFTLTPGEKGKVEVTVAFNAPTTYMGGDKLPEGGINAIYLYRGTDPKPIHIFDHPANGEALSYLDTDVSNGTNVYSVLTLNDNGNSDGMSGEVWVGEDFAMYPENFKVSLIGDSCVFTWNRPIDKGFHNGYVDLDKLTYNLSFIIEDVLPDNVPLAYGIKDSTYSVAISEFERFASKDRQVSINFTLAPVTSIGEGVPAFDNCLIGKPYDLPFEESFANNTPATYPWGVVMLEGDSDWFMVGDSPISEISPYDNDGGMAMYYQKKPGISEGRLQSPNISLAGVKDPVLEFYMFHRNTFDDDNNYLQVEVVCEDGSYVEVGERLTVSGDFGWQKHEISLKSVKDQVIRLSFRGRASEGIDFYIDNIRLMEREDLVFPEVTDLEGSLSEDNKSVVLKWSEPAEIGRLTLIGYYVYCDGVKLSEDYTTECTYTVQLTDDKEHAYAVSVVYNEGDSPLSNEVVIRPVGIEDSALESVQVYVHENAIHIENAEGMTYRVFDLTGKEVEEGIAENHSAVYLEKGIYLVKIKGASYKCIVL